eukprot:scaffold3219_cov255-Chaetoceros_neogracile.AAC.1
MHHHPSIINDIMIQRIIQETKIFYQTHTEIKKSHGLEHVLAVHRHALNAIASHEPPLTNKQSSREIQIAALLHDVDDRKYFPKHKEYENARQIMEQAQVPHNYHDAIIQMIQLVSCSSNGNHVPQHIQDKALHHLLIPRWSDRLEAVGAMGVVRSYQYNKEHNHNLSSSHSPRARSIEEVWEYATPERFDDYQNKNGGESADMISHYYDKLLHIARPPRESVRNAYLEVCGKYSSKELLEVCLRFGKTGVVDEDYIKGIANNLGIAL